MSTPILAEHGWFVLHCYYRVDRRMWQELPEEERAASGRRFAEALRRFNATTDCQGHCYAIWGHKADLAVLLVDPDLDHLNQAENQLLSTFPGGTVEPVYSFVSLSETSEYMTQDADYARHLREKEGLDPDSVEYDDKMQAFRQRMKHYTDERLFPQLPPHRVMCFYPMNKRRGEEKNWYELEFENRKQLMAGHMVTGRKFAGKVKQLVTGSVGLDDWEWGVTLFADDPFYFKKILYDMRFDEVSAKYGEFGEFRVGILLEPEELLERLRLSSGVAVPANA